MNSMRKWCQFKHTPDYCTIIQKYLMVGVGGSFYDIMHSWYNPEDWDLRVSLKLVCPWCYRIMITATHAQKLSMSCTVWLQESMVHYWNSQIISFFARSHRNKHYHCKNIDLGRYNVGFSTECSCERADSSLRNSSKITIAKRVSVVTFFLLFFLAKDLASPVWTICLGFGRGSSEVSTFALDPLFLRGEGSSLSWVSPSSDAFELCLISRETICWATEASSWVFLTWAL